ncbi:MAG: hypothetical protein SOR93_14165 [Clostridiales Family XIII bacterium]|uniref:hypothetical protein n=1 Tax=Hominibacterium faecale TaxID=2839743 RepID=UPI0022B29BFB|nr:hypothetical protein [Hominibacterium faecale]MCI7300998.1 hypothetical protein [Clostridia bacterium]MDY3012383.1 hypothetical protein [Clostridiales Family XIII bacterium]
MNSYYKTCPYPKPATKKKKRKQNGWKDKPKRHCYYTGRPYAERHELFYGNPLRQISISHGFQVDLCMPIHKLFHGIVDKEKLESLNVPGMLPDPLKWAANELKKLRQVCQRDYEDQAQIELGLTPEQARDGWMQLIGRNYLDD